MAKVQVRVVEPCFINNVLWAEGQEFFIDESMADCSCLQRIDTDVQEDAKPVDGRRKRQSTSQAASMAKDD